MDPPADLQLRAEGGSCSRVDLFFLADLDSSGCNLGPLPRREEDDEEGSVHLRV